MNAYEEAIFDKKAEDSFKSHPEIPNGRDYRWNSYRFITAEDRQKFRQNMDEIFPNAPGAGM